MVPGELWVNAALKQCAYVNDDHDRQTTEKRSWAWVVLVTADTMQSYFQI